MGFVGDFVGDVVGGVTGASQQAEAGQAAAQTQAASSEAAIQEQRRQFDKIIELMTPYIQAGTGSLGQEQAMLGLRGASEQQASINQLMQSPLYQTMIQQGQNALLQNASATGGLRGGNTQAALAQLSPQILSSVYQNQLANLRGLTQLGQSSAGLQASAGQNSASNIGNLLQQQGAALAGGQIASGSKVANTFGNLMGIGGLAASLF